MRKLLRSPLFWISVGFSISIGAGLWYDYPLSTAGDELPLLSTTLKMIAGHTLRPDYPVFYHVAFATYVYLPFVVVALGALYLFRFHSILALKQFVILDYFKLLPLARLISLGAGLVSIYLTYKIAQRLLKDRTAALYASGFMATSLLFSYISHFGRVWPIQIMAMLLAFYLIVLFYERAHNTDKHFALIGLATGFSFGVHFIGALLYAPFLVIVFVRYGFRGFLKRGFWITNGVIAAVVMLVFWLNPAGFLNYAGFLNFLFNPAHTAVIPTDYVALPFDQAVSYYGRILLAWDPVMLLLACAGVWALFRKDRAAAIFAGGFAVFYYVVVSILGSTPRYITPVIPFLAILAGYALRSVSLHWSVRRTATLVTIVFVLLLLPPIAFDVWALKQSTRSAAIEWISENVPAGKRIVLFDAFMPLNENAETRADVKAYTADYTARRAYLDTLDASLPPSPEWYVLTVPLFTHGVPTTLTRPGYDYAVVSFWSPSERGENINTLKRLTGTTRLVREAIFGSTDEPLDIANDAFSPIPYLLSGGQNGPTIELYKLR